MRSELSVIKSAVNDSHDQTHEEQGLDDEAKELRRRQMEQVSQVYPVFSFCENMYWHVSLSQYDRVAKLKDDLVVKYKLGGGQIQDESSSSAFVPSD